MSPKPIRQCRALVALLGLAIVAACGGSANSDGAGDAGAAGWRCVEQARPYMASCEHANLCVLDPLPNNGDPRPLPGVSCPGKGGDPYCWDYRCTCTDSKSFQCTPGTCA